MLCRGVPKDTAKFFQVSNSEMVHLLMHNGVYPLYSDGNLFYFRQTPECKELMSVYRQQISKKGGK